MGEIWQLFNSFGAHPTVVRRPGVAAQSYNTDNALEQKFGTDKTGHRVTVSRQPPTRYGYIYRKLPEGSFSLVLSAPEIFNHKFGEAFVRYDPNDLQPDDLLFIKKLNGIVYFIFLPTSET